VGGGWCAFSSNGSRANADQRLACSEGVSIFHIRGENSESTEAEHPRLFWATKSCLTGLGKSCKKREGSLRVGCVERPYRRAFQRVVGANLERRRKMQEGGRRLGFVRGGVAGVKKGSTRLR